MPEISTTTTFPASPSNVWKALTDPGRYSQWNTMHAGFPQGPPSITVGEDFNEAVSLIGFPAQIRWTVTEVDPPMRWSMQGRGPMGVRVLQRYSLAESTSGTTLSVHVEFTGPMIGMMSARLSKETELALAKSLNRLSGLLENSGTARIG